ncbi:MAG: alpha/beta hydrolase [Candidatus Hydrogenedentes bacterium]|nr:alpha/beta hydrolase [Candidatus Hydrogenedentota bacterium]
MSSWQRTFLRRSSGALLALGLAAAGCASLTHEAPKTAGAADLASLANADAFAPDAPPLPGGFDTSDEASDAIREDRVRRVPDETPVPDSVSVARDVVYGEAGAYRLLLDLYAPRDATPRGAGLVFVHGGAWERHGRDYFAAWAAHFAARGYVCASIDYRISGEAPFPSAVEDTKCAIRWMRGNASTLGIDPEHIALIGQSAGAHLALMAAYTADDVGLEGSGGHASVSSRVRAVVDLYGPTDLTVPLDTKEDAVRDFLGAPRRKAPERYAEASPLAHVTPDDPATLIIHGTVDVIVPVEQSDRLAAALGAQGIPYVYDRQSGWHHAMDRAAAVNARCLFIVERFLERYLDYVSTAK